MDQFELEYPEVAKYWHDPAAVEQLELPKFPESAPIYESWEKAAKRLISGLWKFNQSWIFHEPVDPQKLQVPDYFEIIKNPMDFQTIKDKLAGNKYLKLQEMVDDVELTFRNCLTYNGDGSSVGKMCK